MKAVLILITLTMTLFANKHTYLLDEYTKEIELESKIVTKIAKDILNQKIYLFIPNGKDLDLKVYSKNVKIVNSCDKANFVFIKYGNTKECDKNSENFYILTNNYRQLLKNKRFIGAFFWSKSRPNIVLIKQRLNYNKINLPTEYNRYIEEL